MFHRPILQHKTDLLLISGIFLLLGYVILFTGLQNYLVNVFLFYGVPAIYISFKQRSIIKKSIIYSILFSLPATFILDYMGHVSSTWYEPSVSGIRILNSFPIDAFIWAFLFSYFVTVFYKYFFDRGRSKKIFTHNTKLLFYIIASAVSIFTLILIINKEWLAWPKFYVWFVLILFLFPIVVVLSKHTKLINKVLLTGIYFVPYQIVYELIALNQGDWVFPGQHYIGWVELFSFRFPFEELLWIFLAVPAFVSIYEYFDDDLR